MIVAEVNRTWPKGIYRIVCLEDKDLAALRAGEAIPLVMEGELRISLTFGMKVEEIVAVLSKFGRRVVVFSPTAEAEQNKQIGRLGVNPAV